MARKNYQKELNSLRDGVIEMGELVHTQFERSIQALSDRDEGVARDVITTEDAINEHYLELDRKCIRLLSLQQPVAGDLRFIVSSFKINTELERIGDIAVNVAKRTERGLPDTQTTADVLSMAKESSTMVADVMDAYGAVDVGTCREIIARDDQIDQLAIHASRQLIRGATYIDTDATDLDPYREDAVRLLLTIDDLEQVADHATNIAARTVYMATGDDSLLE
ncbi:phosphate signaling complex protein PhoU [Halorubrum vacuolatum]|uniref:Phosphate-specific transport system accessory protein PhoU n=1 Tax=Halorubrum vacuolatum TaxID=63740 RepID=A0A238WCQ2_HALVU|nr:phosphate signaling complex protein PhoU [Halorubrum vacuolatum]SNR44023.1 phosphate transport system protein [Halorubrum vacuolatum]